VHAAQPRGGAQVVARLNTAVRENLRFYAIVTVASVVGVVLLLVFGTVNLTSACPVVRRSFVRFWIESRARVDSHGRWKRPGLETTPNASGAN
jgi:hypothetical protein